MYYLKIKAQKVQSFIFKVPRLKTMLGANSLLGQYFVHELPNIRDNYKQFKPWEDHICVLKELPNWKNDNILDNFKKGVICSAGGHFETFLNDENDLNSFIKDVIQKAKEFIPNVKLSFYIKQYNDDIKSMSYDEFLKKGIEINDIQSLNSNNYYHIDNPFFRLSGEDGENPEIDSSKKEHKKDSYITKLIKKQGKSFAEFKTNDHLCQLLKEIQEKLGKNFPDNLGKKPKDISSSGIDDRFFLADASLIPGNNKIAIISIDGNAMGEQFNIFLNNFKKSNTFDAMVEFEKFWFDQRNKMRSAIKNSISTTDFNEYPDYLPFNILMLGGDDLLMVTVPELAIPLTISICQNLDKKLTVSAGIAIIKHSYPFSHGNDLANSLLDSAKIKSRKWNNDTKLIEYENAIDWHIHFTSGITDIDTIRKSNYYLQYGENSEILTQKPYFIDKANEIWEKSKELYKSIQSEDGDAAGRNKYKRVRNLLKKGERHVKLYGKLLCLDKDQHININYEELGNEHLSFKINNSLDIIELMDLHKRRKQ